MIRWQHKVPDPSHPVDPHHDGTGEWVCYQCRAPIWDAGQKVNMALTKDLAALLRATTPLYIDPDQHGLEDDGS